MDKRIIYKKSDGTVSIIIPVSNETRTVDEIAKKDVPTGFAYKIVDDDFIPTDRTFRNAWTINNNELTDGVGD